MTEDYTPPTPLTTSSTFSNASFSSFTASSISSCTSVSTLTVQEDICPIPTGAVVPRSPPPNAATKRKVTMSFTQRRGYTLTLVLDWDPSLASVAKGALEPRAGALPRRKKAVGTVPGTAVTQEAKQFEFNVQLV
ncbi:hypothetical protein V5O48_012053 [Marasmius crinis-equi]|uniref:Uncharacterized protein n=1 Tax=Marasmius crinis-equi TaxID=585013 RepID=A0ABR3F3U2_9AGAR